MTAKRTSAAGSQPTASVPAGASTRKATKTAPAAKAATTKAAPAKKTAPVKKTAPAKAAPATKSGTTKAAPAKKTAPVKKTAPAQKTAPAKAAPATKAATTKAATTKAAPSKTAAKQTAPVEKATPTKKAAPTKAAAAAKTATPTTTKVLRVGTNDAPWTAKELREVRAELEAERERASTDLRVAESDLHGLTHEAGEGAGDDQADAGASIFGRKFEMSLAANSREKIEQIEHALERLDDGSYGICESCGQPIGKIRLQAAPRATLCLACKTKQESR